MSIPMRGKLTRVKSRCIVVLLLIGARLLIGQLTGVVSKIKAITNHFWRSTENPSSTSNVRNSGSFLNFLIVQ